MPYIAVTQQNTPSKGMITLVSVDIQLINRKKRNESDSRGSSSAHAKQISMSPTHNDILWGLESLIN